MWWVRTAENWHYQEVLLWFLGTCWDEDAAAYAAGLLQQHTNPLIKLEDLRAGFLPLTILKGETQV